MPSDALAPYPWSHSISRCLTEGYGNADRRRGIGPTHVVWKDYVLYVCIKDCHCVLMCMMCVCVCIRVCEVN